MVEPAYVHVVMELIDGEENIQRYGKEKTCKPRNFYATSRLST